MRSITSILFAFRIMAMAEVGRVTGGVSGFRLEL